MLNCGEILKSLRENANMTQDDLAKALNISLSAVSSYEREVRDPPSETLIIIADIFHVSVDYLLGREQRRRTLDITGLKEDDADFVRTVVTFLQSKNKNDDKMPLT